MKKISVLLSAIVVAALCVTGVSAMEGNDVTAYGTPIAQTTEPQGGGNHDIGVIVDGVVPASDAGSGEQYDTYHGNTDAYEEYFGLDFGADVTFTGFEFTEGMHFGDGGYFVDGTLRLQICQNGTWNDVATTNEVGYPVGTAQADFGDNFETYTFECEPTVGTAIRVIGTAGGSDTVRFASCAEVKAFATSDMSGFTTYADKLAAEKAAAAEAANAAALKRAEEGFIEGISTPITTYTIEEISAVSGGSKDLATINDGYIPVEGDSYDKQFDTVNNVGKWEPYHEEYIGYEFPGTYTVEYVEFHEGGNFFDGGFFSDGEIWLEALVNGEWTRIDSDVSPEYKYGETQEEMKPDYETYTLTPKTPVTCDGIRVSGCAGGSAYFISCGELIVKASVSETAPAAETEVETEAAEAAVEETVAETEAETVAEETVAETEAPAAEETTAAEETVEEAIAPEIADETAEKAPQTADLALVSAAVAAVSSLGAYVVSKKRR